MLGDFNRRFFAKSAIASYATQLMFRSPALRGQVGVIAPRSRKFCAKCNRLRLMPGGEFKGCLLSEGTFDLRTP